MMRLGRKINHLIDARALIDIRLDTQGPLRRIQWHAWKREGKI